MLTRRRKSSLRIGLSHEARATLERWQRSTTVVAADVGRSVRVQRTVVRQGGKHCLAQRLDGIADAPGHGARGGVSPEVAIQAVRRACERPDSLGHSLSPWDFTELVRALIAAGIVAESSTATVCRMLAAPHLNP